MDANGCFSATCGNLKSQDISTANKCVIKKTVREDVDGCELQRVFVCYKGSLFANESIRV